MAFLIPKIISFALAFFVGVVSNGVMSDLVGSHHRALAKTPLQKKNFRPSTSGEVEVWYTGETERDGMRFLKFRVTNFAGSPVTYMAYAEKSLELPMIEINGEEIGLRYCGTGLEDFQLASGEALEVKVPVGLFDHRMPEGGASVRIGYYFREGESDGTISWSQSIWMEKLEQE